ncbi:MAG: 5'/3'-nucleotidase SurE [Dehalococcoidales bacterium]
MRPPKVAAISFMKLFIPNQILPQSYLFGKFVCRYCLYYDKLQRLQMKILVTNDDGIFAEGLWTLVRELSNIAQVTVVAPDREQSAVGTAVTLWQPLRVRKVNPMVPEVETYAVEGTPSDSVMLALGNLVKDKVDLVISGINQGLNLGDDVHISGTVGAALQGYLHGFPSLAISTARGNSLYLDNAAKLAVLLAPKIISSSLPSNLFLNINLPDLPLAEIGRIQITRLANESHINTVEEGHDGKRKYYWLVRQKQNKNTDKKTDIWAIEHGNISITPLSPNLPGKLSASILDNLCSDLFHELKSAER